jgi:uncharacterized protein (DUF2267 family)
MSLEESFLEKLRQLPPDRQREVLDFVEFLQNKTGDPVTPRRSVKGLWADLESHITEEDIAEVRAEMWRNFPREGI